MIYTHVSNTKTQCALAMHTYVVLCCRLLFLFHKDYCICFGISYSYVIKTIDWFIIRNPSKLSSILLYFYSRFGVVTFHGNIHFQWITTKYHIFDWPTKSSSYSIIYELFLSKWRHFSFLYKDYLLSTTKHSLTQSGMGERNSGVP